MRIHFNHSDSNSRGYSGIVIDHDECRGHLQGVVKDNLLDREELNDTLQRLRTLKDETGFEASAGLLADIQALEEENVQAQNFRVGEAYAEVILEQEFSCRFHWNELRDARNPKGNKTGADLVGFVESDGQVLFLFGEVKTSSEIANRPPQVMTSADGIEKQLRDLYYDRAKRQILISYLKSKVRNLEATNPFRLDYEAGERAYYSSPENYHLFGVLVRDVDPHQDDLSISYNRLRAHVLEPKGLNLLALYLPIPQQDWMAIINE